MVKNVPSYNHPRKDLVDLVSSASQVLDVGCSIGATAALLKKKFPSCRVTGLDLSADVLSRAAAVDEPVRIDLADLAATRAFLAGRTFDLILAGDVLEHLPDPWSTMNALYGALAPGGTIVASVPNVAHWEIALHLLAQRWPYRERGVFDDTHLRFFMRRNLPDLVPAGGRFRLLRRLYRIRESRGLPAAVGWALGLLPWIREYFVHQYLFSVTRPAG